MNKLIKILIIISVLLINTNVFAKLNCGAWAENSISNALNCQIISMDSSRNYFQPITRKEIAELIANAYLNTNNNVETPTQENFIDINDENVNLVSTLGIMNGYGDGTFMPDSFTSRQEMAKIILTYKSVTNKSPLELSSDCYVVFSDFEELSPWAKPYVSQAYEDGLISGYEDNTFKGFNTISWQEAIVMIERVSKFTSSKEVLYKDFSLDITQSDDEIYISWDPINNEVPHTLTITEQRLSRYENDIPPNNPVTVATFENEYKFKCYPNKKYEVKISCFDKYLSETIFTPKETPEGYEAIALNYPTTEEEADTLVTEITVPVWQLHGDDKIASKLTLKVHKDITEKVVLVFEEIFNGSEKFPIKDIGGYSWRGGKSEHNGGTAIDINNNENYCIYMNGTTIGSHWKPYEDPYSITPYGDVIRAFEKYGFTWGGDAWSNPKDYMHFSYLGT